MGISMTSWLGALALLCMHALLSSAECNTTTYFSLRAQWGSPDDACKQSLSLDLWLKMRAEGSEQSEEAQHVLAECVRNEPLENLELLVNEDWIYHADHEDCGHVTSRVTNSASYACNSTTDLEALCGDDGVSSASRVGFGTKGGRLRAGRRNSRRHRRLKETTSEAGDTHGVDELIAGLAALGCANTQGEGESLCIISDSFNYSGQQDQLQADGDLPPDIFVVEDLLDFAQATDEGSALMEVAYDIAPNAIYKFHTATTMALGLAEAINTMADAEQCSVIVDDIYFKPEPAYRDGPIALAVDAAVNNHNVIYFNAAGNDGPGLRFDSVLECTDALFTDTREPCDAGVSTNAFDTEASSNVGRYFIQLIPSNGTEVLLKWDEDEGSARDLAISVWYLDEGVLRFSSFSDNDVFGAATRELFLSDAEVSRDLLYLAIHQVGDTPADLASVNMQIIARNGDIAGADGPSIFGGACATKAISVAAMSYTDASGSGGEFADPEDGPIASYSSRGTCMVSSGSSLEERMKPVTTAAAGVSTSTEGFSTFPGTSVSSTVAAAIATLIRAACAPEKVVGHDEIMEILTDYDYTVDFVGDADGATEAFGGQAGYGIISASKALAWVETNCAAACPGDTATSPAPTSGGVLTEFPTMAPSSSPAEATRAPIVPSPSPELVLTNSPVTATPSPDRETPEPTTLSPTPDRGTFMPAVPSPITAAPSPDRETPEPEAPSPTPDRKTPMPAEPSPTTPETDAPKTPRAVPTSVDDDPESWVEAGDVTTVTVTSTGYDERPGAESSNVGCGTSGCMPELSRDKDLSYESRWSCKENIVGDTHDQCELMFHFEEVQHVEALGIYFHKWDERTRFLKISVNGTSVGNLQSNPDGELTTLLINEQNVRTIRLESIGLSNDEWISIREVAIGVVATAQS